MASAVSGVDSRRHRQAWRAASIVPLLLLGACSANQASAQRDLATIRDELTAQRKANDDQRRELDEIRIRVEQLESRTAAAKVAAKSEAGGMPDLPVVRVQPPAALEGTLRAPPVDTRVAIKDDAPIDLNAVIARNSPIETAFATAISFYNAGDWENAATGFKHFVGRFPGNDLVPQAIYLHGMSEVGLQRWSEAAVLFEDVIRSHAKSDSMAGALVGLARCEVKRGHGDKARPLLRRVLDEYPGSVEASQANAILDEMGAAGRS